MFVEPGSGDASPIQVGCPWRLLLVRIAVELSGQRSHNFSRVHSAIRLQMRWCMVIRAVQRRPTQSIVRWNRGGPQVSCATFRNPSRPISLPQRSCPEQRELLTVTSSQPTCSTAGRSVLMVEQLVFHWYFRLRTKACFTDRTDHTVWHARRAHWLPPRRAAERPSAPQSKLLSATLSFPLCISSQRPHACEVHEGERQ